MAFRGPEFVIIIIISGGSRISKREGPRSKGEVPLLLGRGVVALAFPRKN